MRHVKSRCIRAAELAQQLRGSVPSPALTWYTELLGTPVSGDLVPFSGLHSFRHECGVQAKHPQDEITYELVFFYILRKYSLFCLSKTSVIPECTAETFLL